MCRHIFTPLKSKEDPNPQPRNCSHPEYKDGWCKRHHPEAIEQKRREHEERAARWKEEEELKRQERAIKALETQPLALINDIYARIARMEANLQVLVDQLKQPNEGSN